NPAATRPPICSAKNEALVVRQMSRIASMRDSISMSRCKSLRTSGSPPVIRIFSTPSPANTRARRLISSNVSISFRSIQTYLSRGIQYVQRKLQRSVTEILKSLIGRLNASRSVERSNPKSRSDKLDDLLAHKLILFAHHETWFVLLDFAGQ